VGIGSHGQGAAQQVSAPGATGWERVAGREGLALALIAWYTAGALDVEAIAHQTVLPLLRRGGGRPL
jgi:succinate-acetate transporter protein